MLRAPVIHALGADAGFEGLHALCTDEMRYPRLPWVVRNQADRRRRGAAPRAEVAWNWAREHERGYAVADTHSTLRARDTLTS